MPEKDRVYTPTRGYDLELKIKDLDYSGDLNGLRIVSSLSSAYQIIFLNLFLDSDDIILDGGLFGQDPLKLTIRLLGQDENDKEQLEFELMYIKSIFDMPAKSSINNTGGKDEQGERVPFKLVTVVRQPFKTMTTNVNYIYEGKKLKEIIEDLGSKVGATSVEIDDDSINPEIIDQVIIPPITFYKAITYLDETFGIYEGVSTSFCQFDNSVYVKNLTKRINNDFAFKVHLLSTDLDNTKIIEESLNGLTFYTYDSIKSEYKGNTKFANMAKNIKYIVKPKDKLFHLIEKDLETVCKENGLIFKNSSFQFDEIISNRVRYDNSHTGYNETETFANAEISKKISSMSMIKLIIHRNLPILNLTNVGECVKFDTNIVSYGEITGKYILHSSDILFNREKDWECGAIINLIRTNKTIS